MNKKGFTLIELLAVILILGIIALIAIPTVNSVVESARLSRTELDGNTIIKEAINYCTKCMLSSDENCIDNFKVDGESTGKKLSELLDIKGDIPDYEDFIIFEVDNKCNAKYLFQKDGYTCSNFVDENGNSTYVNTGKTSDKVKCTKEKIKTTTTVILSTNGEKHTMKSYYENSCEVNSDISCLKEEDFHSPEYNNKIKKITFTNKEDVPENAVVSWDLSDTSDNSIIGWLINDGENNYDLFIGSKGKIYANENAYGYFAKLPNLLEIEFGNFYTDDTNNFDGMFAYDEKLTRIDVGMFNTSNATNMSYMFYATGLLNVDLKNFDMSEVENIDYMFSDSVELRMIDISGWNTKNVRSMKVTFGGDYEMMNIETIKGIEKLNTSNVENLFYTFDQNSLLSSLDLSSWDVSNVTDMEGIFYLSVGLKTLNLSNWNTKSATNTSWMFAGYNEQQMILEEIKGIKNFDMSHVINASGMFYDNSKLKKLDLSNWNLASAKYIYEMFFESQSLEEINISGWKIPNVVDMAMMFGGYYNKMNLQRIVGIDDLDVSSVKDMEFLFERNQVLTSLDLSKWNVSNVENMRGLFYKMSNLTNLDISTWHTDKVKDMSFMFSGLSKMTNLDVHHFNTSNVTTLEETFGESPILTSVNVSGWDTHNVKTIENLFYEDASLKMVDLSSWDVSNVENMKYSFAGYRNNMNFEQIIGIENWNTKSVTNLAYMFSKNMKLESLNLSKWNVSNVTDMEGIFAWSSGFKYIDISGWNTSNVTNMSRMFNGSSGGYDMNIIEIKGIEDIDTSNVIDMAFMFWRNRALTSLDLHKWNTSNVESMASMFGATNTLANINLSGWNTSKVKNMNYMFAENSAVTSLDLSSFNTSNVNDMQHMFKQMKKMTELDISNFDYYLKR